MLTVIAASPALNNLRSVSPAVWLRLAAVVVGLILFVVILRKLAHVNKVVLAVIVGLIVTFVGFNWIYQRNEPAWATPFIDPISKFFPTKDSMK